MTHARFSTAPTVNQEERVDTARRMLEPVAELLLGEVPCPTAVALLKQAFIEAAERRIRQESDIATARITRSRLAFLTGLDARAISKILDDEAPATQPPPRSGEPYYSPLSDLLGMWSSHPDWRDPASGQPRVLPVYGQGLTFQTLVNRSVGKSISYSVVMEQLLKAGNIRRTDGQALELVNPFERVPDTDAPLTHMGSVDQLCCLGRNIMHKQTATGTRPEQHWPRGLFWNRRIPPAALEAIRLDMAALLDKHGREIDAAIEAHAESDARSGNLTAGVGWYYWEDEEETAGD